MRSHTFPQDWGALAGGCHALPPLGAAGPAVKTIATAPAGCGRARNAPSSCPASEAHTAVHAAASAKNSARP